MLLSQGRPEQLTLAILSHGSSLCLLDVAHSGFPKSLRNFSSRFRAFKNAPSPPVTAPAPAPTALHTATVAALTATVPPIIGTHAGAVTITAAPVATDAAPPIRVPFVAPLSASLVISAVLWFMADNLVESKRALRVSPLQRPALLAHAARVLSDLSSNQPMHRLQLQSQPNRRKSTQFRELHR